AASRVTIDTDLTWQDGHRELSLSALAVVETKAGSAASEVDRLLWRAGHRPARISKYATALAALPPDLPATPWRRTLRRHFAADPAFRPRSLTWPQASCPLSGCADATLSYGPRPRRADRVRGDRRSGARRTGGRATYPARR